MKQLVQEFVQQQCQLSQRLPFHSISQGQYHKVILIQLASAVSPPQVSLPTNKLPKPPLILGWFVSTTRKPNGGTCQVSSGLPTTSAVATDSKGFVPLVFWAFIRANLILEPKPWVWHESLVSRQLKTICSYDIQQVRHYYIVEKNNHVGNHHLALGTNSKTVLLLDIIAPKDTCKLQHSLCSRHMHSQRN